MTKCGLSTWDMCAHLLCVHTIGIKPERIIKAVRTYEAGIPLRELISKTTTTIRFKRYCSKKSLAVWKWSISRKLISGRWERGPRPQHKAQDSDNPLSISATLRTLASRGYTIPRLFIIASHIVVIVIIMILYRFPLSAGVVAVLFHEPRLVSTLRASGSHGCCGKWVFFVEILCVVCLGVALRAPRRGSSDESNKIFPRGRWLPCVLYGHLPVYVAATAAIMTLPRLSSKLCKFKVLFSSLLVCFKCQSNVKTNICPV